MHTPNGEPGCWVPGYAIHSSRIVSVYARLVCVCVAVAVDSWVSGL